MDGYSFFLYAPFKAHRNMRIVQEVWGKTQIVLVAGPIYLVFTSACMNILFIIKATILLLVQWSYRFFQWCCPLSLERLAFFEHMVQSLLNTSTHAMQIYVYVLLLLSSIWSRLLEIDMCNLVAACYFIKIPHYFEYLLWHQQNK